MVTDGDEGLPVGVCGMLADIRGQERDMQPDNHEKLAEGPSIGEVEPIPLTGRRPTLDRIRVEAAEAEARRQRQKMLTRVALVVAVLSLAAIAIAIVGR